MLSLLSFHLVIQLLVNGILLGAIYGIAAIGLSLIFGTMRIIFLAQGSIIVLASYAAYWLFTLAGLNPYLSLPLVVVVAMVVGFLLYRGLFTEAAASEDKNISLLIAIGVMFLVDNLMTVLWSADPRSISTPFTEYVLRPMGIELPVNRLTGFMLAILAAVVVIIFLKKTLIGTAVRAASEDMTSATLMGISPHRVNSVAFAIGIGLAGVAGVSIATIYPFDPFDGFSLVLKAMIALAIGGIGSVSGALIGGIILGLLESVASFTVGGGWSDAIAFVVFLAVLMLKPEGLLVRSVRKA